MDIWDASAIGFFGNFHCIGICGPIALALPRKNDFTVQLTIGPFLYNIGRVVAYTLLGLARAVTTGTIFQCGIFIMLFGMGTLPAMMTMALTPSFISLE